MQFAPRRGSLPTGWLNKLDYYTIRRFAEVNKPPTGELSARDGDGRAEEGCAGSLEAPNCLIEILDLKTDVRGAYIAACPVKPPSMRLQVLDQLDLAVVSELEKRNAGSGVSQADRSSYLGAVRRQEMRRLQAEIVG